jgi:hypothetical protein
MQSRGVDDKDSGAAKPLGCLMYSIMIARSEKAELTVYVRRGCPMHVAARGRIGGI